MKQFSNPANPLAHYETTGPEIYEQLDGQIDYLAAGAGSGGTFSGVMKYLKEQDPDIKGVLADPAGSSSGAALYAALKLAEEIEEGNVVAVLPDRGDRYISKGL